MMQNKKELVNSIAKKLKSYGFTVYIADSKRYGFYTDGVRCVSFGGQWEFSLDFSGNYLSARSGTGWQLETCLVDIDEETAHKFIEMNAPCWATTENVSYTTPEQHLKTYGKSSGYVEFTNNEVAV